MFSSIKSKIKIRTFPVGNLAKYSLVMFVSPNTKLGHVLTFAPEYSAAIKTLKALKLSGYVNKVWKKYGSFLEHVLATTKSKYLRLQPWCICAILKNFKLPKFFNVCLTWRTWRKGMKVRTISKNSKSYKQSRKVQQ